MKTAGTTHEGGHDIRPGDWVDRLTPRAVRPYLRLARLDRPIGIWILLFPCWWSVTIASPGLEEPWEIARLFALFLLGAVAMRGAGCTFNDIIDRDLDAQVERTRVRPLPSGAITVPQAAAFLVLELALGLAVVLAFDPFAIMVAVAALPLVALYPFMKRITDVPQAWLGLTMTWGALLGYAARTGTLGWEAGLLYVALWFWTLGYDTIYGYADRADDEAAGVRSLARRLGRWARPWFVFTYSVCMMLIVAAGALAGLGEGFYWLIGLPYLQLLWQVRSVDLTDPGDCLRVFRSNRWFLALVLLALIAGQLTATPPPLPASGP